MPTFCTGQDTNEFTNKSVRELCPLTGPTLHYGFMDREDLTESFQSVRPIDSAHS